MAKHRPNIVRTSISIPYSLKRQMAKVSEDVNWSALACRAFEAKLAELSARKEKRTMDDVVNRLRASKQRTTDQDHQAGYDAGQEWAKDTAEAAELERLASFWRDTAARPFGPEEFFAPTQNSAESAAEHLAWAIQPAHGGDCDQAATFWATVAGDEAEQLIQAAGFLRGFVDGALAVWRQVQAEL